MAEFVKVAIDGRCATLTIDRPQALNALNQQVLLELREAFLKLEGVFVVIVTGAGEKAFVAGADISAMSQMGVLEARAFVELGQGVIQVIQESPFVTLAAVNGFALGGGLELALACDLIYASDNARLGLPETNLGLIPGFGGTLHLGERIGFHHALQMVLTGDPLTAVAAKEVGLVLDVFPKTELMTRVKEIATKLSRKGLLSLLAARRLMRANASLERERSLLLERETFAGLFASGESQEGMKAFLEKRPANFPFLTPKK